MAENVMELTNRKFSEFAKKGISLIDFYADWCMPCVMMGPIVEALSQKFKGKIKFGKVNVEDSPELSKKFRVSSIPKFVILKDGEIAEEFVGSISEDEFEKKLKKYL